MMDRSTYIKIGDTTISLGIFIDPGNPAAELLGARRKAQNEIPCPYE